MAMELLFIILHWLFPQDPVRQVWIVAREWLLTIFDAVENDIDLLHTDPQARIDLESHLIAVENTIRMVIEGRARQIAGVSDYRPFKPGFFIPTRARPVDELLVRLANVTVLCEDIERLAHKRAQRLRRELERNPLGLTETIPQTDIIIDAIYDVAAPSPQDWGRWTGASSRRDGGGSLHVRGPP